MTIKFQRMVARTSMSLGLTHAALGDEAESESAYQRAIEQCSALTALHGTDLLTSDTHATCLTNLGNLFKRRNQFTEAAERLQKSIDIRQKLAFDNESNLSNLKSLALTQANLGDLYADQGKIATAIEFFESAQTRIDKLLETNPDNPSYTRVAKFVQARLMELRK